MKKHLCIVAAAALTVGGIGLAHSWAADVTDSVRNATTQMGLGSADKASEKATPHAEEIHDVLAQVAEAACTKNGLDDIVERFVDADRNRMGKDQGALKNSDALNGRIAELQKDWKAKYNNDFDIKDEDKTYNLAFATIAEGEEARTASGTVSTGDVTTPAGGASVSVDNKTGVDKIGTNTGGNTPADTNRNDPGRNVAVVHIVESHGLPALDVPFIHEAGGWKIDVPDTVDAAKLRDNVQAALTDIDEKKADWPADADEAYRHATHRILVAIFDKQITPAGATGAMTPAR